MAKSMRSNLDIDRNRELDEATPVALSDVETMPKAEEQEREIVINIIRVI